MGAFGPHGSELLQLSRGIDETTGEELVVGMKLTGDANVPAGELSFRARVSRRRRLPVDEMYPAELGVVARCVGGWVGAVGHKGLGPRRLQSFHAVALKGLERLLTRRTA